MAAVALSRRLRSFRRMGYSSGGTACCRRTLVLKPEKAGCYRSATALSDARFVPRGADLNNGCRSTHINSYLTMEPTCRHATLLRLPASM